MTEHDDHKDIDSVSGVETTGHEWDGIKELNNPMPRWWLIIFFITIVWAIGYWVVYPAWPTISGATKGALGWTQFKKLEADQAEITAKQAVYAHQFGQADFSGIMQDPKLYTFAVAGGRAAFKDNCATCHGTGAAGSKGFPNLNDDDWLWGGKISDIYQTLRYGIRAGHDETRLSQMPAFGRDGILPQKDIESVVNYVLALSKGKASESLPGRKIFADNCAACHGDQGQGGRAVGAPRLSDGIWLYGGDRQSVYQTVYNARAGVMPYWKGRLDEATIRQLSVYVYSLGGGEPEDAPSPEEITTEKEQPDADKPASRTGQ